MITYKENRQLIEDVFEYDVILIPMGINNSMNRGLAYEVKLNFPDVYKDESRTGYCDTRKYGKVTFSNVDGITFALCYMKFPMNKKREDMDYINYRALETCLDTINKECKGKRVAMNILGVDGSRGNPDKVKKIIEGHLTNVDVTIYTEEARDFSLMIFRKIAELHQSFMNKELTPDEYLKKRSKIEWTRRNGIYKEMPEDYTYIPKRYN
jgi:hypothetical protein